MYDGQYSKIFNDNQFNINNRDDNSNSSENRSVSNDILDLQKSKEQLIDSNTELKNKLDNYNNNALQNNEEIKALLTQINDKLSNFNTIDKNTTNINSDDTTILLQDINNKLDTTINYLSDGYIITITLLVVILVVIIINNFINVTFKN